MRLSWRRAGYTAVVIVGVTGLLAAQLDGPARASAPAIAPGAGVQPGAASADATVLGLVPQASGLSLTTSAGQTISSYVQNETEASAATLNLGGLGQLLANSPLCGVILYPNSAQPQQLTANSAAGPANRTSTGNVGGAGTEAVSVSQTPEFATATTTPVTQSIPGVLQVTGTATTAVRYLAGSEQEADASVTENISLIGGLVRIDGMSWMASQHSGAVNESKTSFSFGSITLAGAGVPVTLPSTDSAGAVVQSINSVIALFGFHLTLPVVSPAGAGQPAAIGPLQLHFSGSPLDNVLLAPTAQGVVGLEDLIAGASASGSDCSNLKVLIGQVANPANSIVNVALAAGEGSGGIDVDLGGARALTQPAPQYTSPFVSGATGLSPLPPGAAGSPSGLGGGASSVGTVPSSQASAGSAATTPGPVVAAPLGNASPQRASSAGPSVVRCVTTSASGGTGCWRGLGSLAAIVVVVLGAGLLAADLVYGRRARVRRRRRVRRPLA